jgi:diacylglycerol kinase (ATP)
MATALASLSASHRDERVRRAPLPQRPGTGRPRLRSTTPPLLLVANGNSSGLVRRPELVDGAKSLLTRAGSRVDLHLTSSVEELAALVVGEERRTVLLGGDGSLHAFANVPGPKPPVALLPAGGANNVARSLGIPLEPEHAARLAVQGAARPLDLIAASSGGRRMLAVEGVSVGFHSQARSRYHAANSSDVRAGLVAGLGALASFRPFTVAVESDGALELRTVSQLFVSNLGLYGPGFRVAPDADPTDGRLELVEIQTRGRLGLVPMLARLRDGAHLGRRGVRLWQAERIRIATGGSAPVIADTTNLGTGSVELTVVPAALPIVSPRS